LNKYLNSLFGCQGTEKQGPSISWGMSRGCWLWVEDTDCNQSEWSSRAHLDPDSIRMAQWHSNVPSPRFLRDAWV